MDRWTFALAILGATLGIINTIIQLNRNSVFVRLAAYPAWTKGSTHWGAYTKRSAGDKLLRPPDLLIVRVINHSQFDIRIATVYFGVSGAPHLQRFPSQAEFPISVAARHAHTFTYPLKDLIENGVLAVRDVRVETDCGVRRISRGFFFKMFARRKVTYRNGMLVWDEPATSAVKSENRTG